MIPIVRYSSQGAPVALVELGNNPDRVDRLAAAVIMLPDEDFREIRASRVDLALVPLRHTIMSEPDPAEPFGDDSGFYAHDVNAVCRTLDVRCSITIRHALFEEVFGLREEVIEVEERWVEVSNLVRSIRIWSSSCCVDRAQLPPNPARRDPQCPPPIAELLKGGHPGRLDEVGLELCDSGARSVGLGRLRDRQSVLLGQGNRQPADPLTRHELLDPGRAVIGEERGMAGQVALLDRAAGLLVSLELSEPAQDQVA